MIVKYKARFEKRFQRCTVQDQARVAEAIEQIVRFFETRQAPEGLGMKKLFSEPFLGVVCEARATVALRVLFGIQQSTMTFLMVGNHNEVRQFIRSFR